MGINLEGQHALVTGAGRGIGEAVARVMANAGCFVTAVDRNEASARAVASSVGGQARFMDISNEDSVRSVVGEVWRDRPIDILVNCAGNLQNLDRPEDLTMEMWDRIVAVHQRGTYLVTKEVGLLMVARRAGAIVTIASTAGMASTPLHSYAPAKAAVIMQTKCLAAEWGWAGVRVNCVSPGFVETPGVSQGFDLGVMDREACIEASPMRRLVQPEEIAGPVLFLSSDLASAVTGVNLTIDAGWFVGSSWGAYGGVRRAPGSARVQEVG